MRLWAYLLGALLVLATITGALGVVEDFGYLTATDTNNAIGYSAAIDHKHSQSFMVSSAGTAQNVSFKMHKVGSVWPNINVTIQTDSGGDPSGTRITDGILVIPSASLSGSATWYTFSFSSPPTLASGTTYHLVLERSDGSTSTSNKMYAWSNMSANNYADGHKETYAGGSWSDSAWDIGGKLEWTATVSGSPGIEYYYDIYTEDLYNDTNLAGVNVTFAVGCDNLTDANGFARITNETTGCSGLSGTLSAVNLSLAGYSWNQTSYTVALNSSDNASGYQAQYNLGVNKLISGDAVKTPYNITTLGGKTYANGSLVYLLNGSNNVTFSKNTINDTYYNLTEEINATSATGAANLTGAYDLIVGVRVRDANLNLIEENGTFNISINYTLNTFLSNYSTAYTNGSLNFTLERNLTYRFHADPLTYARSNLSLFINGSTPDYYYPLNITLYRERTFNLSFLDEITRELITNTTFELELISDILALNYSVNDSLAALELLTPALYTIRWRSSKHPERDYYETIGSESFFTIRLYSLTTGNATDTLVKVINTQGQTIENATVSLLRYYVACNCYEVVEMAKTGFNGIAYMTAQEVEGHYKWIVEYAGETRFLSTSPENLIADTTTGQITRTITIDLGTNYYESFIGLTDLASSVTYTPATSTLSFIWNDAAGLTTEGCLIARTIENSRYITAGKNCANGTSGNVLLTLANTNTTSYRWSAYVETDTAYSDHTLHNGFLTPSATFTTFGNVAAFGSLFVIVAGAAIFSFSAIAVVLFVGFSLTALIILQQFTQAIILPFGLELLTGFIALTVGISIYLLRK